MSTPHDDGGPAFPNYDPDTTGMSLRDWFAGQAMPQLLIAAINADAGPGKKQIATTAYEMADAMLDARKEKL